MSLGRIAVALLHQHPSVGTDQDGAERMVAVGAGAARDIEGAAQEQRVIEIGRVAGHLGLVARFAERGLACSLD